MKRVINKAKKGVIAFINGLVYSSHYTKNELTIRFNSFKKEDFCCFADDGNTYLTPGKYYSSISKNDLKTEYDRSTLFLLEYHAIDGELGVNLLNCCERCRNLFLELVFKAKMYEHLTRGV